MGNTYLTRETLLKRLKYKDNHEAWEEFVSYYECFIYATINKMGISRPDSDDLSQKVLLTLWESIPQFDYNQTKGKFRNWLYTIIRNTVLAFINQQKKLSSKEDFLKIDFGKGSTEAEIDRIITDEWEKHIAATALKNISQSLSERAMDVFQSEIDGEPTTVTAERLGVEENTIHVYRMRVRKSLFAEIRNLKELLE